MKRFFYYFAWTIVTGIILYLGTKYQSHLQKEAETTYHLLPVIRFASIFPVIIGIFLRLPALIIEIKEKKQWTFDWVKVVTVALPALYIAALPVFYYSSFGENLLLVKELMLVDSSVFTTTAGIVFGYVLLDSFKK